MNVYNKIKISNIYNIKNHKVFQKYIKFTNNYVDFVDFKNLLPTSVYDTFIKTVDNDYLKSQELDSNCNFIQLYNQHSFLLDKIKEAKINKLAYKAFLEIEKNDTVVSILKTFRPKKFYADRVNYKLNSNVTGRLVVKEGPNILTLPKRCRSIIESRFKDGKIVCIDFNNLEPRICLKLSGKDAGKDIYLEINDLLSFDADRSVIKRAIISVLYGASYKSLDNISAARSLELFECVKNYFDIDNVLKIAENIDSFGIRRNYYGRPLWNLEETKSNIILNNYVQSSAVDLALNYFYQLTNNIDINLAVPIFILHDAIIFDVNKEYEEALEKEVKLGYHDKNLGFFPLSLDIFNNLS